MWPAMNGAPGAGAGQMQQPSYYPIPPGSKVAGLPPGVAAANNAAIVEFDATQFDGTGMSSSEH